MPKPKPFGKLRIARAGDGGLLLIFPGAQKEDLPHLDPGNWRQLISVKHGTAHNPNCNLRGPNQVRLSSLPDRVVARRSLLLPRKLTATVSVVCPLDIVPTVFEYPRLERAANLQARVKLWLKRNGFHTDEPLAVHVEMKGKNKGRRTLLTRNLGKICQLSPYNPGLSYNINRAKSRGVKPHDWQRPGNAVDKGGKIILVDSELFDIPDEQFQRELEGLLKRATGKGRG